MTTTADPPLPAPLAPPAAALARAIAAYWHAATRALSASATRDETAYADALEALHMLAAHAPIEALRHAAGDALRIARRQWTATGRDQPFVVGRGVWIDGGPVPGGRLSIPGTIMGHVRDQGQTSAIVQLEADDKAHRLVPVSQLTPRIAERVEFVPRSRVPATPDDEASRVPA